MSTVESFKTTFTSESSTSPIDQIDGSNTEQLHSSELAEDYRLDVGVANATPNGGIRVLHDTNQGLFAVLSGLDISLDDNGNRIPDEDRINGDTSELVSMITSDLWTRDGKEVLKVTEAQSLMGKNIALIEDILDMADSTDSHHGDKEMNFNALIVKTFVDENGSLRAVYGQSGSNGLLIQEGLKQDPHALVPVASSYEDWSPVSIGVTSPIKNNTRIVLGSNGFSQAFSAENSSLIDAFKISSEQEAADAVVDHMHERAGTQDLPGATVVIDIVKQAPSPTKRTVPLATEQRPVVKTIDLDAITSEPTGNVVIDKAKNNTPHANPYPKAVQDRVFRAMDTASRLLKRASRVPKIFKKIGDVVTKVAETYQSGEARSRAQHLGRHALNTVLLSPVIIEKKLGDALTNVANYYADDEKGKQRKIITASVAGALAVGTAIAVTLLEAKGVSANQHLSDAHRHISERSSAKPKVKGSHTIQSTLTHKTISKQHTPTSAHQALGIAPKVVHLTSGDTIWSEANRSLLQSGNKAPTNTQIYEKMLSIMNLNHISADQARHLPVGTSLLIS